MQITIRVWYYCINVLSKLPGHFIVRAVNVSLHEVLYFKAEQVLWNSLTPRFQRGEMSMYFPYKFHSVFEDSLPYLVFFKDIIYTNNTKSFCLFLKKKIFSTS